MNKRTLRRLRREVRGREKAYRKGRLDVEELSVSVASRFAHVSHAGSLRLRRNMVKDSLHLG